MQKRSNKNVEYVYFSLFLALFMGVWNFIAICYGVGVAWGPKLILTNLS